MRLTTTRTTEGSARRSPRGGEEPSERVREKDSGLAEGFIYGLTSFCVRILLILFFDWRPRDSSRVPSRGPAILASSHASFLDPIVVGSGVARRCCFLARDNLFRVPLLGWFIRNLDAKPIPRESAAPRKSLRLTLKILEKGRILVLFPEGTRSADGNLGKLKKGIGWLARRSGAPVVPVRVIGAHEAWPRQRHLPRRHPIQVFFGEPLRCDPEESVDAFLGRLRRAISELGAGEPAADGHESGPAEGRPGSGVESFGSHVSINSAAGKAR